MPRPKEFDSSEALDAAIEVFRRKGYEATSIQDLVDGMGIHRGSLYDTFGDKHALFLAALDRYDERNHEEKQALLQYPGTVCDIFGHFFRRIIDQAVQESGIVGDPFGCLITNSSMERAPIDPACATRAARNWTRTEALFVTALTAGRERGEIDGMDADLRAQARFLLGTAKGLRVAAKACGDRQTLEDIARIALKTLVNGSRST